MSRHKDTRSLIDQVRARTPAFGAAQGCWITGGHVDKSGYPRIRIRVDGNVRDIGTHQVVWEHANGPLPTGRRLRNVCGAIACCRSTHWKLGTPPPILQGRLPWPGFKAAPIAERYAYYTMCGLRPDDCYSWRGAVNSDGYGGIKDNGRSRGAHRVAYELTYGPIPDGRDVLHTCDNPPCSNPRHLFLGDASTNMLDMNAKGRRVYPRGDEHPLHKHPELATRGEAVNTAKLTVEDVLAIRAAWPGRGSGHWAYCVGTASHYGVSPQAIEKIVQRINWKHV